MKRRIAILLAVFSLLGCGAAMAQEPSECVFEATFYTASLYYCDAARGVVVLKDVKPMGKGTANPSILAETEYREIPVFGPARFADGSPLPLADCNIYADSQVRVLLTRSEAKGWYVTQLKFL